MSVEYFTFIDAGHSDVHVIRDALLEIDGVHIAHCPLGPTDLICYGEVKSFSAFKGLLQNKLNELLDDRFHPIKHTETMLVLDSYGKKLTAEEHGCPKDKVAAWVLADTNVTDHAVIEDFLKRSDGILAAYNVVGRYDCLLYVEGDDLASLMKDIDDGIRRLKAMTTTGGKSALAKTDTRLVLM